MALDGKRISELARVTAVGDSDLLALDKGGTEANSIYVSDLLGNSAAKNKVTKTGDTMTGNLTLDNSSLVLKGTNDNIYYVNKLTTSSGGQNVASMEISGDGDTKKLYMDSANGYRPHFNNGTTDYTLLHNGDFVNLNNGMDYVIESWQSGTSWYRLYKSGWLEQGGRVSSVSSGNTTVSFTKVFNDTNFELMCLVRNATDNYCKSAQYHSISTTSFAFKVATDGGTLLAMAIQWEARGYAL